MDIKIKNLGLVEYRIIYDKMRKHSECFVGSKYIEQIWCLQHYSVFTHGRNNNQVKDYNLHNIPLIETDRGGLITYHGPGQAIIYFMLNLRKRLIGIRRLISCIQDTCIECLKNEYHLNSYAIPNMPGIYVNNKKIASVGLRVKHGKTYHGIAINACMDLSPFKYIDPCGYSNLEMTQISTFYSNVDINLLFFNYINLFINNVFQ